jgi:heterodisulfide reductase subunit A-like polyferredoxin
MVTPSFAKGEKLVEPYAIKEESITTEILVVGGGTTGTIAAIQSGRAGADTILIESGSQLGGTLTTGGVSFPGIFHARWEFGISSMIDFIKKRSL